MSAAHRAEVAGAGAGAPLPAPDGIDASHLDARRRRMARLRWGMGLALGLPSLAFLAMAAWLYRAAFDDTRVALDHASRIAQEHALKLFDTNEMLLQRMLDLVAWPAGAHETEDGRAAWLHERLRDMAAPLPQVQGLFIIDASAHAVANSIVHPLPRHFDYSDREWFPVHREGRQPVFVTEQFRSRATQEPAFDMSRRIADAKGHFGGTVHVSLRPEYLTRFYEELAGSMPGLRMSVLRGDGRLVARWPGHAVDGAHVPAEHPLVALMTAGVAAATGQSVSPFDGADTIYAARSLAPYPLYVVAGLDEASVLQRWRRNCGLLALFIFPTALGIAAAAWQAERRTRRELASELQLARETVRRERAELALVQAQKLEAIGRLTGGVAHDFNNLLMVVSNSLHLHRLMVPAAGDSPPLAAIERAVIAGTKLTRQLLAFARKQALRPERIVLQERLPALLDLLRPLLGSKVELRCEVAEDTEPIEVDAAELELALINLAANARDAMDGPGRFVLTARNATARDATDGPRVVIEAQDSGPGIDPRVADQVFEPFFTTKPLGEGTGLGLSQVQALCQSAGGEARVVPHDGPGAHITLSFRPAPATARTVLPAAEPAPSLNCALLLVEDNPQVAQATGDLLRSMGCRVAGVADGRAALAWLAAPSMPVDVVLSDIEMPGELDGIALATALRQRHLGLPVVLMTGYASRLEQAVQQRLEVLPKPCTPAMLAEALRQALSRARAGTREAARG